MPELIFAIFVAFVSQTIRACVRAGIYKARTAKPKTLCADCFYAHVQYATNGRRAVSCTYGGVLRPMNLDVLYCTDYLARNAPSRTRVVGFVREIAPAE